jgi:hypothetical protein
LAAGDAFTGTLSRDAGESAGDYLINQGTLSLGQNYVLSYVGAKLTVRPVAPTNVFGSFSTPLSPSLGQNNLVAPTTGTGNQPGGISVADNSSEKTSAPLFCPAGAACSQKPFQDNLQYGQWIQYTGPQQ